MDTTQRLEKQFAFILEMDKLKSIWRRTYLPGTDRHENDAEHSWQLAMMVLVLHEHAAGPIDVLKTLRMVLIHDIVEIDAGDTFCYDEKGNTGKATREQAAAGRIFGLLPADQRDELRALWEEFEARRTPEARFAAAVDRLMPMLHNYHTGGRAWREHGIHAGQVRNRNCHIEEGSPALWTLAQDIIRKATSEGLLLEP